MSSILSLELIFALVMYGAGVVTGSWASNKFKSFFTKNRKSED